MLCIYHVHQGNKATNEPRIISLICCKPINIIPSLFILLNLPLMVPLFLFLAISTFHFISYFLTYCSSKLPYPAACKYSIPIMLHLFFSSLTIHSPSLVMYSLLQFLLSRIHCLVILPPVKNFMTMTYPNAFFFTTTLHFSS